MGLFTDLLVEEKKPEEKTGMFSDLIGPPLSLAGTEAIQSYPLAQPAALPGTEWRMEEPQGIGALKEKEPTVARPRWDEFIDATARGMARTASAFQTGRAALRAMPQPPGAWAMPQTPGQINAAQKASKKLRENADFLWEVSKNPALAAQNKDLASKALNLIGETIPYITATTAGYITAGPMGGFAVGSLVEGNSAYRVALDYGVPEDKAKSIGIGVGIISGAIEAFGGRYAEDLLLRASSKLRNKMAKGGAAFGIGTIVEALEEGGQEIAQITGEESYRDVDWNERVSRVLGSMAGGGFLGGTMRGGGMMVRGVAERAAPPISDILKQGPAEPAAEIPGPEELTTELNKNLREQRVKDVAEKFGISEEKAEDILEKQEQAKTKFNQIESEKRGAEAARRMREEAEREKAEREKAEKPAGKEITKIGGAEEVGAPATKPPPINWKLSQSGSLKGSQYRDNLGLPDETKIVAEQVLNNRLVFTPKAIAAEMRRENARLGTAAYDTYSPLSTAVRALDKLSDLGYLTKEGENKWDYGTNTLIEQAKYRAEALKQQPAGKPKLNPIEELRAESLRWSEVAQKYEGGRGLAVGSEGINYRWKSDILLTLADNVEKKGMSIDEATEAAKKTARQWIKKHNARRPKDMSWQRWEGAMDSTIETVTRDLRKSMVEPAGKPAPAEVGKEPQRPSNKKPTDWSIGEWRQYANNWIEYYQDKTDDFSLFRVKHWQDILKTLDKGEKPTQRDVTAELVGKIGEQIGHLTKATQLKRPSEVVKEPTPKVTEKEAEADLERRVNKAYLDNNLDELRKLSNEARGEFRQRLNMLISEVEYRNLNKLTMGELKNKARFNNVDTSLSREEMIRKIREVRKIPEVEVEQPEVKEHIMALPKEQGARKITPAKGRRRSVVSLEDKKEAFSFTDYGTGIGQKGKVLYHIATQKELATYDNSTDARKAATVMAEETGINWKEKDLGKIRDQWDEWLKSKGFEFIKSEREDGTTDFAAMQQNTETRQRLKEYLTGKGKELQGEDFPEFMRSRQWVIDSKERENIISRLKGFVSEVPEFSLNPVFTVELVDDVKMLVWRDGGTFRYWPPILGLNDELLNVGDKIRIDLESLGIKKPSAKKLKQAEILIEPKNLGREIKGRPVKKYGGKLKMYTQRKMTKAEESYERALSNLESGTFVETDYGGYSEVTKEDIRNVAELGKKAGRQGWTVERDILAHQSRGQDKNEVPLDDAIKIIRNVFAEKKPQKKGGGKQPGYIGGKKLETKLEPKGKPVSAAEIINYMERAFEIPIRGKATHRKYASGWFDPRAIGIRMKDVRSLSTGAHEIAHHIDWTLNNRLSKNPPNADIRAELMKLGRALYGQTKPPGGYKSEGWAEFVREYLTGEQAKEKAPAIYKWFTETYLPSHKDVKAKLARIKEMITSWRMQGAEARIESQISKKTFKGGLIERFQRAALWLDTAWRNELAPLRYWMKKAGIEEESIKPGENPYQIAVARADKAGAVTSHFALEYTTDLAGNRTGKGLREILAPVSKDITKFTDWIVAARARLLHKKGINSGIQHEDANYIYEKYDSPQWQNVLKEITEWNHRLLDYLCEAGGLEKEAKQRIIDANPIYIPFMRAFKPGEIRFAGRGTGRGVAQTRKAIKKITGSGREIIDPIESMINQAYKIISIAHKTQVARALANLSQKKGMASMIWRVPAPTQAMTFEAEQLKKDIIRIAHEKMGVDPGEISSAMLEHWDELLTVYSNASHYYGKDNIVSLVIDGKRSFYEVAPELYRAIEGIDQYTLRWQILAKPARGVRLGATGLNPAFGLIRNFLRDALTFTTLSKHAKAGPASAALGVIKDIAKTPEAQKFKALGGKMSSQILADRRALQHLKSHVLSSTASGKTIYTVSHPIDALRELFGVTEAGTRIGEFGPALKAAEKKYGENSVDAAIYALNQAQDVTTNFSRHGRIGKVLNQMIPFFNAGIQGPDKIVRTFRERPIQTTFKAIAGLTIPAIWSWWKYKDEEWYKNMPVWERNNYIHFRIPKTQKIIRIPVPFELGYIFQSAPIAFLDGWQKEDPKIIKEMFEDSAKNANPFDWPAVISPVVDILANEDFAGRPIVPAGAEYKLPENQYRQYTTELMKIIGKTINYSPAKIEHLLNSYSGGLYLRVMRTVELKDKKEIGLKDMPVLSTLFLREPYAPRQQLNRFYERRDYLNRKYSSDKKSLTQNETLQRRKYNKAADRLSELWKELPMAESEYERATIYEKMKSRLRIAGAMK